jgi:hypothetical protein
VQPSPEEERCLWEGIALAKSLGIVFPPRVVEIRFAAFDGPTSVTGLTKIKSRPVAILIRSGLSSDEIIHVVCHELRHAHDELYGPALTPSERESSAHAFEATAAAVWQERQAWLQKIDTEGAAAGARFWR